MLWSTCSGCGESVLRNANVCRSCGHPNAIDCPACHAPMEAVTHERLRLDICRKCDGVWFDRGELRRLPEGKVTRETLVAKGFRPEEAAAIAERRGDASKSGTLVAWVVGLLTGW